MQKLEIFIDAEYVIQSLRAIQNKPADIKLTKDNFNWVNFIEFLSADRPVDKVYYYTARMDETENIETYNKQTEFLNNIEQSLTCYNIEMRLGKMNKTRIKRQSTWNEDRKNKPKDAPVLSWVQKGIDSKIILDLCKFAYTADKARNNVAVIVTGDEDFAETISTLNELQIKTELVTFNRKDSRAAKDLIAAASTSTSLDYPELKKANIV